MTLCAVVFAVERIVSISTSKYVVTLLTEEDVITKALDPMTITQKLDELRAAKAETQTRK